MFHIDNKGIIHGKDGIPKAPRYFSDGRINFALDETGIINVNCFLKTAKARASWVFTRTLFDGFRWFVQLNNRTYKLKYDKCEIYPYGIKGYTTLEIDDTSYSFMQEVLAINESIIVRVTCDKTFSGYVKYEFNETFAALTVNPNDCQYNLSRANRKWHEWKFDGEKTLLGAYDDDYGNNEINNGRVYLSTATKCDYVKKNNKHIFLVDVGTDNQTALFAFNIKTASDVFEVEHYLQNVDVYQRAQEARYSAIQEKMPVLNSKYSGVNDFMAIAPIYHESLKTVDIKGAVKANNLVYWTWCWDSITATESYGYWHDIDWAVEMLEYFYASRSEEHGMAASLKYDDNFSASLAAPAQGYFITLLHYCYSMTDDMSIVKKYYDFSKWIVAYFEKHIDKKTGFMQGESMFPDFPEYFLEDGNDLATINNMIAYCALRSMEKLANLMDDIETLADVKKKYTQMEESFDKYFYDKERKFYVTSIDSNTGAQRPVHVLSSVKFENLFLEDMIGRTKTQTAEFIEENLMGNFGLRDMALDCTAYDGDSNQLHCWWPVNSEYFINVVNSQNKGHLLDKFAGYIEYWTGKLMCPEGISYYLENDGEEDRWNCNSGIFQAYSVRGWYQAVIHGIVGVKFDGYGINVFPYDGDEISIQRLAYKDKIVNVTKTGKGQYLDHINVNGTKIHNINRVPYDILQKENDIVIHCTEKPYENGHIILAQDVQINQIGQNEYEITGNATNRIYIVGNETQTVYINGEKVEKEHIGDKNRVTLYCNIDEKYILSVKNH